MWVLFHIQGEKLQLQSPIITAVRTELNRGRSVHDEEGRRVELVMEK